MSMTIQQRMQMLNLEQVGASGPAITQKKAAPPPPPPRLPPRSISTSNGAIIHGEEGHAAPIGNRPAAALPEAPMRAERKHMIAPPLPRRTSVQPQPLPAQNARTPDLTLVRSSSRESIASTVSTTSAISIPSTHTSKTSASSRSPSFDSRNAARSVKAPEFDPATLPKLPPKRAQAAPQVPARPQRPSFHQTSSSCSLPAQAVRRTSIPATTDDNLPPLPVRRNVQTQAVQEEEEEASPQIPQQTQPQPPKPRRSALEWGMAKAPTGPSLGNQIPLRPNESPQKLAAATTNGIPPPIPTNSKPSAAQINTPRPRPQPTTSCLACRDFIAQDTHASHFPRQTLTSIDITSLATQLTTPFPSPTDKARTIFTWLHHNISYNTTAFFSNNVQPSTPSSTISTGLAVCEGYAGLFVALALASGLEAIVIAGHGKGYGYTALKPGQAIPDFSTGHAWAAVRIDGGEWKLTDPCWGAGALDNATQAYKKRFNASQFTMSNADFGRTHFPKDANAFFFPAGITPPSWESYFIGSAGAGEDVLVYGTATEHGLSTSSFLPPKKHIKISGRRRDEKIQFQFAAKCEHFDPVKAGLGKHYVYTLHTGGRDGRKQTMTVFETNGNTWWLSIPAADLGCAGQTVSINAITSLNGRDGRGVTTDEMKRSIGRYGWGGAGIAQWQLV